MVIALRQWMGWWLATACIVTLAGCPGGGGSIGGSISTNQAPVFTSAGAVTVGEETTGAVYTATARDPDGDAVTFSISGGNDAARFAITPAGVLSFVSPPDFEAPDDADHDNVYLVTIAASDGRATTTLALAVTVTNVASSAWRVRRVVSGMNQPVFVAPVPDGSGRVFVVELGGRIRLLQPNNGAIAPGAFLDVRNEISTDGERGLLGFATAPDFMQSGTFHVFLTVLDGTIEVRRYRTFANDRNRADPSTMQVVLRQPHPRNNHNGGWIGFGPDGMLYVAIGDGGGSGDPDDNGQDRDTLLGKILRLDVSRDDFPADAQRNYAIPEGNPFAGGGGAPEVWALGLRNPFRNAFDPVSGALLIGDVGQNTIEEIDLMRPQDGGANFGWPILEGTRPFEGTGGANLVPPVAEYEHGIGERRGDTVIGGYVYRGPVESLRGLYVFADFVRGNVWTLPLSSLVPGQTVPASQFTVRNADFAPNLGAFTNLASFGVDQAGNLYFVDMDGEIFVLEAVATGTAVPSAPMRSASARASRSRHFCAEEWDGASVLWSRGAMIVGGEGFTCVRQYYERQRALPARD